MGLSLVLGDQKKDKGEKFYQVLLDNDLNKSEKELKSKRILIKTKEHDFKRAKVQEDKNKMTRDIRNQVSLYSFAIKHAENFDRGNKNL